MRYINPLIGKIEEYTGPFEDRGLKDPAEALSEFNVLLGYRVQINYLDEGAFAARVQVIERKWQRVRAWNTLSSGEKEGQS